MNRRERCRQPRTKRSTFAPGRFTWCAEMHRSEASEIPGRVVRVVITTLMLGTSACGGGGDQNVAAPLAVVSTVVVSPENVTLTVGATQALGASARSANGAVLSAQVVWSSSASSVAAVSASGVVTAIAPGTAEIRAVAGGVAGTARVTVEPGQFTLTMVAGPGVSSVPPPGAHKYPANSSVKYSFTAMPGYQKVVALLGDTLVSASGSLVLSGDVTVSGMADSANAAPPPPPSLTQAYASLLQGNDPVSAYLALEREAAALDSQLSPIEAEERANAAFRAAFDPTKDGPVLASALDQAYDSLRARSVANMLAELASGYWAQDVAGDAARPTTFLYSNGVWSGVKGIESFVQGHLKPAVRSSGAPSAPVYAIYNKSGTEGSAWLCATAVVSADPTLSRMAGLVPDILGCFGGTVIGGLKDVGQAIGQYFNLLVTKTPGQHATDDAAALANAIDIQYAGGRGVVVVAHSQGNLVASEAINVLKVRRPDFNPACLAVVSIELRRVRWTAS